MSRLQAGIGGRYLPRYEDLANRAIPEDAQVTSLMVRHEAALLDVVTREAAGDTGGSLASLQPLLRLPLLPAIITSSRTRTTADVRHDAPAWQRPPRSPAAGLGGDGCE
jgi:hypothetical protein